MLGRPSKPPSQHTKRGRRLADLLDMFESCRNDRGTPLTNFEWKALASQLYERFGAIPEPPVDCDSKARPAEPDDDTMRSQVGGWPMCGDGTLSHQPDLRPTAQFSNPSSNVHPDTVADAARSIGEVERC